MPKNTWRNCWFILREPHNNDKIHDSTFRPLSEEKIVNSLFFIFVSDSNFLIAISLQHDGENLWYF